MCGVCRYGEFRCRKACKSERRTAVRVGEEPSDAFHRACVRQEESAVNACGAW